MTPGGFLSFCFSFIITDVVRTFSWLLKTLPALNLETFFYMLRVYMWGTCLCHHVNNTYNGANSWLVGFKMADKAETSTLSEQHEN